VATERPPVHLLAFELSSRRLVLPLELLETILRAVAVTPLTHSPQFDVEGVGSKYPRLRFRFTTGYSPTSARLEGLVELSAEILHKPYGLNDLARAVRRAFELAPR
jgi:hypothetical protein